MRLNNKTNFKKPPAAASTKATVVIIKSSNSSVSNGKKRPATKEQKYSNISRSGETKKNENLLVFMLVYEIIFYVVVTYLGPDVLGRKAGIQIF